MPVYDDEKTQLGKEDFEHKLSSPSHPGGMTAGERADETAGLESDFAAPARKDEDRNTTTKEPQKEESGGGDDGFYNEEGSSNKTRRAKYLSKRNIIAGGGIGIFIGLLISVLSFIRAPLEFVQISQLLQKAHFTSIEDSSNSRTLKLYKYVKGLKNGNVEDTRLGVIEKRVASNIDKKLSDAGISKEYANDHFGTYEGVKIDQIKFSENASSGADFKGLGEADFMAKFKEKFGVDLTPNGDGTFTAAPDGGIFSAYFKNRNLNKLMLGEADVDGVGGAVASRVMGKRDGITWHPIRALDTKVTGKADELFSSWLKGMKDRIIRGQPEAPTVSAGETTNPKDGTTTASKAGTEAADSTNKAIEDAKKSADSGETTGVFKTITESTGGKTALTGAAVVGVACSLKAVSDSAAKLKHDEVILPLIRTGMQAISLGNQIQSGQDIDSTQLGYFAKQLSDSQTGSWVNARSIQAESGDKLTGPDIPDPANPSKIQSGGMFTTIINGIPGLATICKVSESAVGKLAFTVISLTTPVATIATTAITSSSQFKDAIKGLIGWLAGSPIPSYVTGATYGNYINYGARLASNETAASMGGKKLTKSQEVALKNYDDQAQRDEMRSKSFATRVLDPTNPSSLAADIMNKAPDSVNSAMASIVSNLAQPIKLLSSLKIPLIGSIYAASNSTTYDYGFSKVGFSLDELNSNTYADPYANAEAVKALLANDSQTDYIGRAKKCFGVDLTTDGGMSSDLSAQIDPTNSDYPSDCADSSQNWTRIRFYILDMKTAQATDCYLDNNTNSCQQSGF